MKVIESKNPVLVISYHNCEIHVCHLDGYKTDKVSLLKRISQIESFFNKNSRCRVWYNIDDTVLSDDVIEIIQQNILHLKENIVKLAIIGTHIKMRRFRRALNKKSLSFPVAYFDDAELAKKWLI